MELALRIPPFQQPHLEPGGSEQCWQGAVIVDGLVARSGMIDGPRTADLHNPLVRLVREQPIRHSTPNEATGPEEVKADVGGHAGLREVEVLPDVLGEYAAEAAGPKPRLPVGSPRQVKLFFLGPDPPRIVL
jgi:hypothetical protein